MTAGEERGTGGPLPEALYRRLFESSPLMMILSEVSSGRYLEVNDTFLRVVGYAREQVLGRTSLELGILTAEGRGGLARALESAGTIDGVVLDVRRKDGTLRTCRFWIDRAGDLLLSAGEDITEQRRLERERAEAFSRLEKLARRVPGMVYQFRLEPDGRSSFPYTNEGIREVYALSPEEVQRDASLAWSRIHPDDLPGMAAAVQASAHELTPWTHEYRVRWPDGSVQWILGSSAPEKEPDGSILWHGFAANISERKRLESDLAQAERLAAMGLIAAGVAHEVNNPLAAVLANLESAAHELAQHAPCGRAAEDVKTALEGVQRIRRISQALATFSRVEHGERERVEVHAAVEAAVTIATNEVRFRARLVKELGPVPPVAGTEGKLAQVVLNLLLNAAHAIPEGRADAHQVTVRTRLEGDFVVLEVEDSGAALAAEQRERIFEAFSITRRTGQGEGLGLAVTRNIVTSLGGAIEAHAGAERGARFTVRLPAARDARPPLTPPRPLQLPTPVPTRGRVLLVDDEDSVRRSMARLLAREHEVVQAASGVAARELLQHDRAFDVILCDLMMPEVTGMELHAWLAEHDPALADRVVFISGGAFTPLASEYVERVKNLRLDKPFDPARLREVISERVTAARR